MKFTAKIIQNGTMNAGFIEFPFDVEEVFGKKGRIAVQAIFDEKIEYRGSLVKMKTDCHILGITREIREKIGKNFGDEILVEITEDIEKREVEIPQDVQKFFEKNPKIFQKFQKISYSLQKKYIFEIISAKKEETRKRRIEKLGEL